MAVLFPNTTYSNLKANRRLSLEISHNSKISLIPNTQKTKKIINIEQWTKVFLRFAAICGPKFPKEMSKLMKYAEIVRDLANRKPGLSWLMYDIQFCCLRQSQLISWDQIHTEFWVMADMTSTFRPYEDNSSPFQNPNQQISQGPSSYVTPAGHTTDSADVINQTATMTTNVVTAVADTITSPGNQS